MKKRDKMCRCHKKQIGGMLSPAQMKKLRDLLGDLAHYRGRSWKLPCYLLRVKNSMGWAIVGANR
jgi:hypothetical protein